MFHSELYTAARVASFSERQARSLLHSTIFLILKLGHDCRKHRAVISFNDILRLLDLVPLIIKLASIKILIINGISPAVNMRCRWALSTPVACSSAIFDAAELAYFCKN